MRKHNSPVLARPCSSTNPAPRVGMFLGALLPLGNTGLVAPYCPLGNTGLVAPYCPLGNTGFCHDVSTEKVNAVALAQRNTSR